MENSPKSLGKIEINIDKNLSQDVSSRVRDVLSCLCKSNIDATLQEGSFKDGFEVIIKILNIGDISDKQMKEVFKIMFSNVKDDGNFCKLIDRDKEFQLPDDTEECLDWFTIEN